MLYFVAFIPPMGALTKNQLSSHTLLTYIQHFHYQTSSSISHSFLSMASTLFIIFLLLFSMSNVYAACTSKCGSLDVKNPFGSGPGCGDPRFYPSVACSTANQQLLFATHTRTYPIKAIDYSSSIITISDPIHMSTCMAMQSASNSGFGLDWTAPFQFDWSNIFVLLKCSSPSLLTYKGSPLCDAASMHLCTSLYSCPGVAALGLPLYSPTAASSCCVYAPVNLGPADEINLASLHCAAYTSVISSSELPVDTTRWEYGINLRFNYGVAGDNLMPGVCDDCQKSNGVCGYAIPTNTFQCICKNGINTTSNCVGQQQGFPWPYASTNYAQMPTTSSIFATPTNVLTS